MCSFASLRQRVSHGLHAGHVNSGTTSLVTMSSCSAVTGKLLARLVEMENLDAYRTLKGRNIQLSEEWTMQLLGGFKQS